MADNLMKRLREGTTGTDVAKTDPYLNSVMQRAADEIERLRAEIARKDAALKGGRQKLATYQSVYPGDKELRKLLALWYAALAPAQEKE